MTTLKTNGRPWVFLQMEPPGKTLRLEGASAPHGRPRKKPIMDTEFELRQSETYYAGQRIPTRHITGDKESPMILVGRFSDRVLGEGGANEKRLDFKEFWAQGRSTMVTWGQIVSYLCMPGKAKFGIESESEISYELELKVDADADLVVGPPRPTMTFSPKASIPSIKALEENVRRFTVPPRAGLPELNPAFFDALADLVSKFNSASAELLAAAAYVDDVSTAASANVKRLLGGIHQYQTALARIDQTIASFAVDAVVAVRSSRTEIDWYTNRAAAQSAIADLRATLSDTRRDAVAATRGASYRAIIAKQADTWESIASRELGGPGAAIAIRDANGAMFGEQPISGRRVLIPLDGAA